MASKPDSEREGSSEKRGALPPTLPASPCDCDTDPIAGLRSLFVEYFQGLGMAAGRDPASGAPSEDPAMAAFEVMRVSEDVKGASCSRYAREPT